MDKDTALDLALEALENVTVTGPDDDGIVWINLPGNGTTGKAILRVGKAGLIAAQCAQLYEEQRTKAITAIKQALAAPVQRPVAWVNHGENRITRATEWDGYGALYTTPPAQPAPVHEPEVSWGVDWAKAGDKSCATIIKRLPNGKIEVVAVEYEP